MSIEGSSRGKKGLEWAISEIPGIRKYGEKFFSGSDEVVIVSGDKFKGDDFSVRYGQGKIFIGGNTKRSHMYALVEVAKQRRAGERKDKVHNFPFTTRNYKLEINQGGYNPRDPHTAELSNVYWESLCKEILKRGFNGIVFYTDHPFMALVDFSKFMPGTNGQKPADIERNIKNMNRALEIINSYGLRTFYQNYVTHHTNGLAKQMGSPFDEKRGGFLAGLYTPQLIKWSQYGYAQLFKNCPELGGLYKNFESSPNCYEFIEEALLPVLNGMKRKPDILYRLWNATVPEEILRMFSLYKGKSLLGHKIMDTADTYHYPAADSRCVEWKRYIGDHEFVFLFGPCHNCGTNLDDELWTDAKYIYKVLQDARDKGADGISFHKTAEPLIKYLTDTSAYKNAHKNKLGYANYFHMELASKFFLGEKLDEKKLAGEFGDHFKLSGGREKKMYQAVTTTSKIIPLVYQQYYESAAEPGGQFPERYNYMQEPFFYNPVSWLNNMAKMDMRVDMPWINKKLNIKVAPDVYQLPYDFVNPAMKKKAYGPDKIAKELDEAAETSLADFKALVKETGRKDLQELVYYFENNYHIGKWVSGEIKASISFYSCYFDKNKKSLLKHFGEGMKHTAATFPHLNLETRERQIEVRQSGSMNYMDWYHTDKFMANLKNVYAVLKDTNFPWTPFKSFVESRKAYNEIRRHSRPEFAHGKKVMGIAERQTKKALALADKCLKELGDAPANSRFVEPVLAWKDFLSNDLVRQKAETLIASTDPKKSSVKKNGSDHNFRMGRFFYLDFLDFFETADYYMMDQVYYTVSHGKNGVTIDLNQYDCDTAELEKIWAANEGSQNNIWVYRIMLDPDNNGKKTRYFTVAPKGKWLLKQDYIFKHRQFLMAKMQRIIKDYKATYSAEPFSFKLSLTIPYKILGTKPPKKGQVWAINLVTNTKIKHFGNTMSRALYEGSVYGKPGMTDFVKFV